MGYAFISYSTKNQTSADAMRDLLRKKGIETWMAPGDIPAGSKYAQVINRAVKDCACFILMLSEDAQNSVWVAKEVERAVNYRRPIIPVQIEDMILNDEFELYISTDQIIAIHKIDLGSDEVKKLLRSVADLTAAAKMTNTATEAADTATPPASAKEADVTAEAPDASAKIPDGKASVSGNTDAEVAPEQLNDQHKPEEVGRFYQKVPDNFRRLVDENPEVFLPDAATACSTLANLLKSQRRPEEAVPLYQEALEAYRRLADENPDAFLPDVARTCFDLAYLLDEQHRLAEAESLYREALAAYRRLAEKKPDVFLSNMTKTCNNLAVLLKNQNRSEEAEQFSQEALDIRRRLAK